MPRDHHRRFARTTHDASMNGRVAIPPTHRAALVVLAELTQEAFQSLCDTLESLPATLQRDEMFTRIQAVLRSEDAGKANDLLSALLGAATLKGRREVEAKELAKAVAYQDSLDITTSTREVLTERLFRLLQIRSVAKVAKAFDMLFEHERVFHGARVITDIRPVFPDDVSEGADGAVLLHTLKLDLHVASGSSELYVALDSRDLQRLKQVLQRALEKDRELRKFLAAAGLALLEVGDN